MTQTKSEIIDRYSLLRSHAGHLISASHAVNKRFLGTPYGSTPIHARLFNQRFLLELTDPSGETFYLQEGSLIQKKGEKYSLKSSIDKNSVYKISIDSSSLQCPLLSSITYGEASHALFDLGSFPPEYTTDQQKADWEKKKEAFLEACNKGIVKVEPNIEALKRLGFTVKHVVHRPNHGLHHSMRVAAYIPMLLGLYGQETTHPSSEVEHLQIMMLFSVIGRLDETGFFETGDWGIGRATYESFRSTSGLEYLTYCKEHPSIYSDTEKAKHRPYQDALVVELMGYSDLRMLTPLKGEDALEKDPDDLKKRILNDTDRLVEMGTLTEAEASELREAVDKPMVAAKLAKIVGDPRNKRLILKEPIPEVLVQYILDTYQSITSKNPQVTQLIKNIEEASSDAEKRSIIKRSILKILADKKDLRRILLPIVHKDIDIESMKERLSWMNMSHGIDLSRCYPLNAQYPVQMMSMPLGIDSTTSDWKDKLTKKFELEHQQLLADMKTKQGVTIIKEGESGPYHILFFSDEKPCYATIDKDDTALLEVLNSPAPPTALSYHQLAYHLAEGEQLPRKSQFFNQVLTLVEESFSNDTWNEFKEKMHKMYDLLKAIQDMQQKTGERINFILHEKAKFNAFLNADETRALYERLKGDSNSFSRKFTSKMILELYDPRKFQDYDYQQTFRIFPESSDLTRDYRAEVVHCARLIDTVCVPSTALKSEPLPVIQDFHISEDKKEMRLTFEDEKATNDFIRLYNELMKPSIAKSDEDSKTTLMIPLENYKYLRDNHFLTYRLDTVPKEHHVETELIDVEKGEYQAILLIKQQRAVVRLHNIEKNNDRYAYEEELLAMEDPINRRRIMIPARFKTLPPAEQLKKRRFIRDPRTKQERIRRLHLEATAVSPELQEPVRPYLYSEKSTDMIYQAQGNTHNTRFISKAAHTLLNSTGTTELFRGALRERNKFFPIGVLSDLNQMHTGGEKYVWRGPANSWAKYWLGDEPSNASNLSKGYTIEELRASQREGQDPEEHNELLLRATKTAIKALVAPKNTLIDRLNLATQALEVKTKYGISVPLIILDPSDPECPKPYPESEIQKDILEAIEAVRKHQFEYDNSLIPDCDAQLSGIMVARDLQVQNEVLCQLLRSCGFTVNMNTAPDLLPKDRLELEPSESPDSDKVKIDIFLKRLSLPGSEGEEMRQISDATMFEHLNEKDAFFIKQVVLGHANILRKLLDEYHFIPSDEAYQKALQIAKKHHPELCSIIAKDNPDVANLPSEKVVDTSALCVSELQNTLTLFEKHKTQLGIIENMRLLFNNSKKDIKDNAIIYLIDNLIKNIPGSLLLLTEINKNVSKLKRLKLQASSIEPKSDILQELIKKSTSCISELENIHQAAITSLDDKAKLDTEKEIQALVNKNCSDLSHREKLLNIFSIVSDWRNPTGSRDKDIELTVSRLRFLQSSNRLILDENGISTFRQYLLSLPDEKRDKVLTALWAGDLKECIDPPPPLIPYIKIQNENIDDSWSFEEKYQWTMHRLKVSPKSNNLRIEDAKILELLRTSNSPDQALRALWSMDLKALAEADVNIIREIAMQVTNFTLSELSLANQLELSFIFWERNLDRTYTPFSKAFTDALRIHVNNLLEKNPSVVKNILGSLQKGNRFQLEENITAEMKQLLYNIEPQKRDSVSDSSVIQSLKDGNARYKAQTTKLATGCYELSLFKQIRNFLIKYSDNPTLVNEYSMKIEQLTHELPTLYKQFEHDAEILSQLINSARQIDPMTSQVEELIKESNARLASQENIKKDPELFLNLEDKTHVEYQVAWYLQDKRIDPFNQSKHDKGIIKLSSEHWDVSETIDNQISFALRRFKILQNSNPVAIPLSSEYEYAFIEYLKSLSSDGRATVLTKLWAGDLKGYHDLPPKLAGYIAVQQLNLDKELPLRDKLEIALLRWRLNPKSKEIPIIASCEAYLARTLTESESSQRVLDALWSGEKKALIDADPMIGKYIAITNKEIDSTLPLREQLELAFLKLEINPKYSFSEPLNEVVKNFFRETLEIDKTRYLIDAIWSDSLYRLEDRLNKSYFQEELPEPLKEQLDFVLFYWKYHPDTKNIPINEHCICYLKELQKKALNGENGEVFRATIDALYRRNKDDLFLVAGPTFSKLFSEVRDSDKPAEEQLEIALLRWQYHPNTQRLRLNENTLKQFSKTLDPEGLAQLTKSLWNSDTNKLVAQVPDVLKQGGPSKEQMDAIEEAYVKLASEFASEGITLSPDFKMHLIQAVSMLPEMDIQEELNLMLKGSLAPILSTLGFIEVYHHNQAEDKYLSAKTITILIRLAIELEVTPKESSNHFKFFLLLEEVLSALKCKEDVALSDLLKDKITAEEIFTNRHPDAGVSETTLGT